MTEEKAVDPDLVSMYRQAMRIMGRNEFLLSKMLEYGFWPKDLPTPHEKQKNESEEEFSERLQLKENFDETIKQIAELIKNRSKFERELKNLQQKYEDTWDIVKIRKEVMKKIWEESKKRRLERKNQRELERKQRSEAWKKKKAETIVFIGKEYSSILNKFETNEERLKSFQLPIINTDHELADFLDLEYNKLRFLTYHRNVIEVDHYVRYNIPKRSGGTRLIAAPKPLLKQAQRSILDKILSKIPISDHAHGFIKGKSVVTGANIHNKKPGLVINIDLEDFFPTITFERVRGMLHSFGYSGHISTLLAILCTYCVRIPIESKRRKKYVAITKRILPQGSPASPMITNIICFRLDKRLNGLAKKFGFIYSRYADDMSFSIEEENHENIGKFLGLITKIIQEEGFEVNHKKTRFLRKNNRQSITGITINNHELGLPKSWIKRLRAAIYNAKKLKNKDMLPIEVQREISGMAAWVQSVNSNRYRKYIINAKEVCK